MEVKKKLTFEEEKKEVVEHKIEKDKNELSAEQDVFWNMYLRRKEGMEVIHRSIDDLVKDCQHWKNLLEATIDSNRILKEEQWSMRMEYEKLLEKIKFDDNIIWTLKDSERNLRREKEEGSKINDNLDTVYSVKKEFLFDKRILKKEKDKLLQKLDTNNRKIKRINKDHKTILDHIKEHKKIKEENQCRYNEELKTLDNVCKGVDKLLLDTHDTFIAMENIAEKMNKFTAVGLKSCLVREKNSGGSVSISSLKSTSFDTAQERELEVLSEDVDVTSETVEVKSNGMNSSDQENSPEIIAASEDDSTNDEGISNPINAAELINETLLRITELENEHLSVIYSLVNKRLNELHDKIMQVRILRDKEGEEIKKLMTKSDELEKLIMVTRKKFKMPTKDPIWELNMRILNKVQENEDLRKLLLLCFSFQSQDFKLSEKFEKEVEEIYISAFGKLEKSNINNLSKDVTPEI